MDHTDDESCTPQVDRTADFDALYMDLRQLAQRRLAEFPPGQTLQATALVHEAWIRLEGRDSPLPTGRRPLLFLVVRAMRDLLVEQARRKSTLKRGEMRTALGVEEAGLPQESKLEDVLGVNQALEALETESPEHAKVVSLRYFAGLTVPEIAELLGCSVSTVERQWAYSRAWLRRYMDGPQTPAT